METLSNPQPVRFTFARKHSRTFPQVTLCLYLINIT